MIEIPEPPDTAACASCASPLRWLWSARTGAWVSFATEATDNRLLRVHECPPRGADRLPTWRNPTTGPRAAPDSLAA